VGLDFKATCDKGSGHLGPFFSVYIRLKQIGSRKGAPLLDRLKVAGVYCFKCIQTGRIAVSVPPGLLSGAQLPLLDGKAGE
jgi:hypothetical protein